MGSQGEETVSNEFTLGGRRETCAFKKERCDRNEAGR